MTTKFRLPVFLAVAVAALALLLDPIAHAFLRSYMNYEVASANQRFVAEVDYGQANGRPSVNLPKVRVHEVRDDKRIFKWEANFFIPISETIHLSDDGESVVLENYYPYSDQVLYFFHNGKEVRRYKVNEVVPGSESEGKFPFAGRSYGLHPGGNEKWSHAAKFAFLSAVNGQPCYCAWYVGETNWLAWRLKDGERIVPTIEQQKTLDDEAVALARRVVEDNPTERKNVRPVRSGQTQMTPSPRPQLPSEDVCFKFLGRLKTPDDRKRIESLLTAADYSSSGYGPTEDIVQLWGYSQPRAGGSLAR